MPLLRRGVPPLPLHPGSPWGMKFPGREDAQYTLDPCKWLTRPGTELQRHSWQAWLMQVLGSGPAQRCRVERKRKRLSLESGWICDRQTDPVTPYHWASVSPFHELETKAPPQIGVRLKWGSLVHAQQKGCRTDQTDGRTDGRAGWGLQVLWH